MFLHVFLLQNSPPFVGFRDRFSSSTSTGAVSAPEIMGNFTPKVGSSSPIFGVKIQKYLKPPPSLHSMDLLDPVFRHEKSWKLTAKASENGWLEDDPFLLGNPIFRGYVSLREGNFLLNPGWLRTGSLFHGL